MTPTTRNTLVIGGGLIVIALLLTCGPMSGLFGSGEDATETVASVEAEIETPPVSAAPQVDEADAMAMAGAATSGAATGAGAGASGAAAAGLDGGAVGQAGAGDTADEPLVAAAAASGGSSTGAGVATAATAAGVGAATAGAGAAAGASGSGSSAATASQAATPPVSTAPPVPAVAVADTSAADAAAGAASAFDDAYASLSGDGIDAAGKVVDRFAPPVAAVPTGGLAMNGAQRSVGSSIGGVRQPCDSPGAGCRNTFGGARPPTPPANPPIIPGQRPPRGGGADAI